MGGSLKNGFAVALLGLQSLHAQSTLGRIVGTVTDSAGAAISSAALSLIDLERHIVVSARTSAAGAYEFLGVPAGLYRLEADHPGLTAARADFRLRARQSQRIDLRLEVKPQAERVDVSANVPAINTENGAISDSQSFDQLARLPLNYRASNQPGPVQAMYVVPGILRDDLSLAGVFAGSLLSQVEYSIDGVASLNIRFSTLNFSTYPSSEMISEFAVSSTGNGAEMARATDVTLTTRGGTNVLHGAASWYHQNRALDAADYFYHSKGMKVFNNFAGALGGPAVLPGWYDGRNRTFFFVDYEGDRRPLSYVNPLFVPTSAWRSGDLAGLPGGPVLDPLTGLPFPGNRVPSNRINAVAARLFERYLPLPNTSASATYPNYVVKTRADTFTDRYDARLDQVLGARQSAFARWSWSRSRGNPGADPLPFKVDTGFRTKTFVSGHTFAIHPSLANEARFGVDVSDSTQNFPVKGRDVVAELGLRGLDLSSAGDSGGFPYFDFSDATGFSAFGMGRDWRQQNRSIQFTDTVSWVRGRHSLRTGIDLRHVGTIYARTSSSDFGSFIFNAGMFSGNAFTDFLIGLPSQTTTSNLGPTPNLRGKSLALFAQDGIQLNRSLTLTLGLRWQVSPPLTEEHGNMANFDHVSGDIIVPDETIPAAPAFLASIGACPAASSQQSCTRVITASQAGLPAALRRTDWRGWQPRAGLAWRAFGPRTVIRAGAGAYAGQSAGPVSFGMTGMHTSDVRTYLNGTGADGAPLFSLPDVGNGVFLLPTPGTASIRFGVDPDLPDWRTYDWNVSVEHEFGQRTTARLTYHGLATAGVPVLADFNQVRAATSPYSASQRPYRGYVALLSAEPLGFVNYQGVQVEVRRAFRNGIFYQAAYTFARDLTNTQASNSGLNPVPVALAQTSLTDRFNARLDRGNMQGFRSNAINFNAIAALPLGKGRRFGREWAGVRELLAGGWELSTVTVAGSGVYQTPTMPRGWDSSNTGPALRNVWPRPDAVAGVDPNLRTGDAFYNAAAFVRPPRNAGRFGTAAPGSLVGPEMLTVSLGAFKTAAIGEHLRLRVEASFVNALNHPSFTRTLTDISQPAFFGVPISTISPRSGQVGARLEW